MKKGLLLFLIISFVIACQGQDKKISTARQETFAKIENVAAEGIKKHNFPSIAIGIIADGKVIYGKGLGYADRERKILADEGGNYDS